MIIVADSVFAEVVVKVLPGVIFNSAKLAVLVLRVTVLLLCMYTTSLAPGMEVAADPPEVNDHVEVALQLPDAIE